MRGLLGRTLEVLAESAGLSGARAFAVKPAPWRLKGRGLESVFVIQVKRGQGEARQDGDVVRARLARSIFIAEKRLNAQPRFLRASIPSLLELADRVPGGTPLIITPFIGPGGKVLCRREGVSYVDAMGNVGIFLESGFILKDSRAGARRARQELRALFAPRASRVIRVFLENPGRSWRYQGLADTAKVSLGQAHNVVRKLLDEEFAEITKAGSRLTSPAGLLDRWAAAYVFARDNRIESFYSDEPSYRGLMARLARVAEKLKSGYAFTLFAGASLVAPFVRTPQVHMYVAGDAAEFAESAGLKPVTSGGNVHLVQPYDDGVLNPIQTIEGLKVVGNVQLYLDLVNYPARGKEQAEEVRRKAIGF